MRMMEVEPGGHTPRHQHDYEHEIYVVDGEGVVVEGDTQHRLQAGDVVHIRPNDVHQFRNDGTVDHEVLVPDPEFSDRQAGDRGSRMRRGAVRELTPMSSADSEILRLRDEIRRHDRLYYVEAKPEDFRPRVRSADR